MWFCVHTFLLFLAIKRMCERRVLKTLRKRMARIAFLNSLLLFKSFALSIIFPFDLFEFISSKRKHTRDFRFFTHFHRGFPKYASLGGNAVT